MGTQIDIETSKGTIRIEGNVAGRILSDDTIVIHETGYVKAELLAGQVIVGGTGGDVAVGGTCVNVAVGGIGVAVLVGGTGVGVRTGGTDAWQPATSAEANRTRRYRFTKSSLRLTRLRRASGLRHCLLLPARPGRQEPGCGSQGPGGPEGPAAAKRRTAHLCKFICL